MKRMKISYQRTMQKEMTLTPSVTFRIFYSYHQLHSNHICLCIKHIFCGFKTFQYSKTQHLQHDSAWTRVRYFTLAQNTLESVHKFLPAAEVVSTGYFESIPPLSSASYLALDLSSVSKSTRRCETSLEEHAQPQYHLPLLSNANGMVIVFVVFLAAQLQALSNMRRLDRLVDVMPSDYTTL